jgi:hypothetical protein
VRRFGAAPSRPKGVEHHLRQASAPEVIGVDIAKLLFTWAESKNSSSDRLQRFPYSITCDAATDRVYLGRKGEYLLTDTPAQQSLVHPLGFFEKVPRKAAPVRSSV